MIKIENLTGQKFGRLTVIKLAEKVGRRYYWTCKCDCGNIKKVRSDSLKSGNVKSCGCLKKEQDKINLKANWKGHNRYKRLYQCWQSMKGRCLNPNDQNYYRYGGRGIDVYPAWIHDFDKFKDWALSHGYTKYLTIDRIDNNKGYYPNNCRWVSMKVQCNNRRSNIRIKWQNQNLDIAQWAEKLGFNYTTLRDRYERGDRPPVLFRPVGEHNPKKDNRYSVKWQGQSKSLYEWSKITGISYSALKSRYKAGRKPPELFYKPDRAKRIISRQHRGNQAV